MTVSEGASFHALRFGRSAARYEAQAGVQARMAEALLSLWGDRPAPSRVLEFGCGTGLLTRRLRARFPASSHLATDASPEMMALARDAARLSVANNTDLRQTPREEGPLAFATLDACGELTSLHALPAVSASLPVELVASGALVQWFPDLATHLRFAGLCAAPQAAYLVSGFDRENFPELNTLLSEPPFSYRNFPGHTYTGVVRAAAESGWTVSGFLGWDDVQVLPDARAVLRLMQDLGSVRDPREGGRMTRENLAYLLSEYEQRFAVEGGVRLTWKPWAALLVRVS
jgi:SAM-dependent methyltransferase